MIRILHIVPNMQAGGLETLIMSWYRNIDRSKVQFDFLVHYQGKFFYDDEIERLGGKIYHLSVRDDNNFIKYLHDLDSFFKEHREYKIVHGHMESLGQFYFRAAKKYGVPVRIAHSHNSATEPTLKGKVKGILAKGFPKYATHCFACSELDNAFVVGAVCRIDKLKNPFFLIDTFGEIKKRERSAKLVWLGSGDLDEQVKQYAKEKGLMSDCVFLGSRTDVNDWYSAMDILLFPSTLEGLGMVLIEAQVSGLMCYTSKNVSEETDLTGLVHFADLSEGAPKWAETILKQAKNYRRISRIKEVTEAGYNIDSLRDDLGLIYDMCLNRRMVR